MKAQEANDEIISIHALREEGDPSARDARQRAAQFLSTPSARRATQKTPCCRPRTVYFYPRPPRGGRPRCFFVFAQSFIISIHALREEGDVLLFQQILLQGYFYPRPPRGGRPTEPTAVSFSLKFLSTPSARRATPSLFNYNHPPMNFYPRPPRGGRPSQVKQLLSN